MRMPKKTPAAMASGPAYLYRGTRARKARTTPRTGRSLPLSGEPIAVNMAMPMARIRTRSMTAGIMIQLRT